MSHSTSLHDGAGFAGAAATPAMATSTSGAAAPAAASSNGAAVHLLWDWDTLPCPPFGSLSAIVARLQQLAARMGQVAAFAVLSTLQHGGPDEATRRTLREAAISIEESRAPATDQQQQRQSPQHHRSPSESSEFLLTRLLRLTLQLQAQSHTALAHSARPSVVVLSNLHALSSSLSLMRQSGLFANVVLIHGGNVSHELSQSASAALALDDLMRGALPALETDQAGSADAANGVYNASHSPPDSAALAFAHLHLRTSPSVEAQEASAAANSLSSGHHNALLGVHPAMSLSSAAPTASPRSAQPLLPTPSPMREQPSSMSAASTPSMRYLSHSNAPSPLHSSSGNNLTPGGSTRFGFGLSSKGKVMAASAPSSPSGSSLQHHARSFFPSSTSPSSQPQQQQQQGQSGFFRSGSSSGGSFMHAHGHSSHAHSHVSSQRSRACVLAYQRIIAYAEQEKLIPRESVLKKRLVDSRADLGAAGVAGAGGLDFEEWLYVVTQVACVGVMEGEAPQRIVWPRGPDGQARRFACADFFAPTQRLSPAQNAELLDFLYRVQPEVEKGRFGFASYLARHGPHFVQLLPHGVLVELVQLLLNQKVLLFRKGKVSVASRSEAIEAQSLGHFFSATDFLTPAQSRATSPSSFLHQQQQQQHQQQPSLQLGLSPPSSESSLWDDKPLSMTSTSGDEAAIWRSPTQAPAPHHIDRALLHQRRGSVGGSPLQYSPFSASMAAPRHMHSLSMPGTRATSPTLSPSSHFESLSTALGDFSKLPRKGISNLQPLHGHGHVHSRSLFAAPATVASAFDSGNVNASNDFNAAGKTGMWIKEEQSAGASSTSASVNPSRRNSLSDLESNWRSLGLSGNAATLPSAAATSMRFEQPVGVSTGFAGESVDACDPSAVLSAKLAQLNRDSIERMTAGAAGDDLARFTAAVQFRPTFHFEKGGAAHTPEWVSVLTFCVGSKKFSMRSQTHSKKDAAKADVSMKALQAIEDRALSQAPHIDVSESAAAGAGRPDSVVDLARLLNFLQQAPVVYYLSRVAPAGPARSGGGHGGRLESRRGSTGGMAMGGGGQLQLGHGSAAGSGSGPGAFGGGGVSGSGSGSGQWSGTTRIQVKSVNVVTGEAQPAVSASTPFTHTVQAAASKNEAKEIIAASLLQQIERARVVNPALFTVLAAANRPTRFGTGGQQQQQQQQQQQAQGQSAPTTQSGPLDSIWASQPTSTGASPALFLPPVDMSLIGADSTRRGPGAGGDSTPGASFFSLHTPAAGRPFQGISAIGISTPHADSQSPSCSPSSAARLGQQAGATHQLPLLRSVSEMVNEDTERVSRHLAECALYETPTHARQ